MKKFVTGDRITPEAIDLFRKMQAIECTCTEIMVTRCTGCGRWISLCCEIHDALALKPWQWPAIATPDDVCSYPPGTGGAEWFPQAQALYRELLAADEASA